MATLAAVVSTIQLDQDLEGDIPAVQLILTKRLICSLFFGIPINMFQLLKMFVGLQQILHHRISKYVIR